MEGVIQQVPPPSSSPSPSSSVTSAALSGTIFHLLPEELLERVFSFLPVPNVFVFRLVCKRWNALLRSHHFLASFDVRNHKIEKKWITFFDGLGYADERSLLLYDPSSQKWHRISLAFLPSKFNIAIAAAGGLFCVASNIAEDERTTEGRNVMCVCNPFTKTYKELPSLQLDLVEAHAIMEQKENGLYKVYVMSSGLMAIYDSSSGYWLNLNIGDSVRPRSPVICRGAIYGLRDEGSLWWQSWKLVFSNLSALVSANEGLNGGLYAGICNWVVLNQNNWGEFSALIRRPRLLGANGCLLLIGGLKKSVLSYSCSTFIIFKFDFTALEWVEIARMPEDLYWGFQDLALVKIFGSIQDVFFFCETTNMTVGCKIYNEQVLWHKVVDCPDLKYCVSGLCKGFTFDLKLGSVIPS